METKPVTIYNKDKKYLASYVDISGKQHDIEFTPENTINIVGLINELKEKYKDFYRLYGVVEAKTEAIVKEYEEEQEQKLTEDVTAEEEIKLTPDNFKDYIVNSLEEEKQYIQFVREDKQNIHQEWGVHIYCYDYDINDDGIPIEGPQYYVPFSTNKKFIDNLLKGYKHNINTVYAEASSLMK